MGTMIQRHKLEEALPRPALRRRTARRERQQRPAGAHPAGDIADIHASYLEAGADIVCTNTFNAQRISLADYGMEELAYEMNLAAAQARARRGRRPRRRRRRTGRASSPARWARPTARRRSRPTSTIPASATSPSTSWREAYAEQARGLIDGGADMLLIETVFDTLNAKAAGFAVLQVFDETGVELPMIISGTITDRSGRTLSGQTTEAFWNSVKNTAAVRGRVSTARWAPT